MITNVLSVDLEEWFQVSNLARAVDRARWESLPSRVVDSTRRLLDEFDAHGQRATFFTLGWVADRQPALLREIVTRGHEVACHGYAHDLVYELGPERFRADLRRARAVIENAAGCRVRGYRAPSYSITRASLFALPILVEEGFLYDSSIFPVHHHRYGIPGFARAPLKLELPGGGSILEFPLTTVKLGPLAVPMAGGAYLRLLPAWLFRWGFGHVVRAGLPAVLYLHPWEIDPGQPELDVSRRIRWNHYHNLDRMQERLATLLARFRFAPMGEVLSQLEDAGRLATARLGAGPEVLVSA